MYCVLDRDLVDAALIVMRWHGDAAMQYAADLALHLAERRDEIGAETWRQIAMAVGELQCKTPAHGERLN